MSLFLYLTNNWIVVEELSIDIAVKAILTLLCSNSRPRPQCFINHLKRQVETSKTSLETG